MADLVTVLCRCVPLQPFFFLVSFTSACVWRALAVWRKDGTDQRESQVVICTERERENLLESVCLCALIELFSLHSAQGLYGK